MHTPFLLLASGCMPSVTPDRLLYDTATPAHGGAQGGEEWTAVMATLADDYSLGALASVDLDTLNVRDTLVPTAGDAVVHTTGELVVVLNRLNADTIQVYRNDLTVPYLDIALPDLSNPQHATVCGEKMWVSLHNSDKLASYDRTTGLFLGGAELAEWAGSDGYAEASSMLAQDNQILVAVQQLKQDEGWTSGGGAVVSVDCESGNTEEWLSMGPSPVIAPGPVDSMVGYKTGLFGQMDGVVGLVERSTQVRTVLVNEENVGADIYGFAFSEQHLVYVTADDQWTFQVHCMDLSTETTTHAPPTTSYISDVSMDPMGRAWISKRLGWSRDEPDPTGMDIIEPEECTSIFEPNQSLPTALAPFNVAFL